MTVGDRIFTLSAKAAVKAGVRVLPLVSDDVLLKFSRSRILEIPWLEGRDFMQRLLVFGKRALSESSDECRRKAAMNFLYNYLVVGYFLRREFARQYGFRPPLPHGH